MKLWCMQFVFGLFVGALFLVLGYGTSIVFLQNRLKMFQEKVVTAEAVLERKYAELHQDLSLFDESQKSVAGHIFISRQRFEMLHLLQALENAILKARADLILFEPRSQEDAAFITHSINTEFYGGYKNLLTIVNSILNLPYMLAIESINLQRKNSSSDVSNKLSLQLLLKIFEYKENLVKLQDQRALASFEVGSGFVIEAPKRDIFAQVIGSVDLCSWPINELKFLGLIEREHNIFGVVEDPLGNAQKVKIGDELGVRHSKVIAINKDEITTSNNDDNLYRVI